MWAWCQRSASEDYLVSCIFICKVETWRLTSPKITFSWLLGDFSHVLQPHLLETWFFKPWNHSEKCTIMKWGIAYLVMVISLTNERAESSQSWVPGLGCWGQSKSAKAWPMLWAVTIVACAHYSRSLSRSVSSFSGTGRWEDVSKKITFPSEAS